MASDENSKVVINLATGHEDAERVLLAFLVGTAALEQGKEAVMFLTKEAARLALPGYADAIEVAGGELYACPICLKGRGLDEETLVDNATVKGATPLWEWIGDGATVFSY